MSSVDAFALKVMYNRLATFYDLIENLRLNIEDLLVESVQLDRTASLTMDGGVDSQISTFKYF